MYYDVISQHDRIKKCQEVIISSRLLLDKHKTVGIPGFNKLPLTEVTEKPKLIIFLPKGPRDAVRAQVQESEILRNMQDIICLNWNEFSTALLKSPRLVLFHAALAEHTEVSLVEFIHMMETLMKCMPGCSDTKLATIVTKNTDVSVIKVLKKSSVIGISPAPSNFGTKESDLSIAQLIEFKPYWPEHIINQLSTVKTKYAKVENFKLTPKQKEVLELIRTRGASNKAIARVMGISESTVKIHVGAILKAYGLRNRTQLALSSKDLLKA